MKLLPALLLLLWASCCLAAPLRVVSQSPALTELLFQLGRGECLVGRSEACDHPADVRRRPCTGRFGDPVPERVLKLHPDLLITDTLVRPAVAAVLRRAGIQVVCRPCRDLESYLNWVTLLGRELDCQDAARREIRRIRAFQEECASLNARRQTPPKRILWVIWDSPLIVAGKGSLPDEVLALAGAVNAAGAVKEAYFKASREWLLRHPPEVVVWSVSGRPDPPLRDPFWSRFAAVRRGAVIASLNWDTLLRPGPRLTDGVRTLRLALEAMP